MTIDRLVLSFSPMKVEAFVVYHMICYPAISLRFLALMSCSVNRIESLTVVP